MYGLVNKAIEDLVTRKYGKEIWSRITDSAGIGEVGFLSMEPYEDAVTYDLVEAASEVLGIPQHELLEAFGEFWTLYTAQEGYGQLLAVSGDSFEEFLGNLDNLHARVGFGFPELKPPSFRCEKREQGHYLLHYFSDRNGLAPMVVGLVRGLAKRFKVVATVEHHPPNGEQDHDVFEISVQD